jgi:hypothetical protein
MNCRPTTNRPQSLATFWGARPSRLHPSASRRRNLPPKPNHLLSETEGLSLMIQANRPYACLFLALLGAMMAGCAVGPNYKRPAVDSPSAFRDDATPTNNSFADLNWWQVYRDDTLQALVREAFTNNYDLRIAVTRVQQARAAAMQARAQFVPNAEYNGAVSRLAGTPPGRAPNGAIAAFRQRASRRVGGGVFPQDRHRRATLARWRIAERASPKQRLPQLSRNLCRATRC